jgi:hypothetical protein
MVEAAITLLAACEGRSHATSGKNQFLYIYADVMRVIGFDTLCMRRNLREKSAKAAYMLIEGIRTREKTPL